MIAELITNNYLSSNEWWHRVKLSPEDAQEYHEKLLDQGNIIAFVENGILVSYIEVWCINFEQLGRLVCELPFYVYDEDIENGNIAYVANLWVFDNEARVELLEDFVDNFGECEFLAGMRTNRNNAFKVYPMNKIKGVIDGRRQNHDSK